MRISDWSSDVCSSDLHDQGFGFPELNADPPQKFEGRAGQSSPAFLHLTICPNPCLPIASMKKRLLTLFAARGSPIWKPASRRRSEEHTSELQSLMRISYAVFCLKKKNKKTKENIQRYTQTNKN